MKKHLIVIAGALSLAVFVSGCASPGGAFIVGPCSYVSARHIDKKKMERSAVMSTSLSTEKKTALIRAVNMSVSPNEIAAGFQINVGELFKSNYTGGELLLQGLSAAVDLAAEAAAGWAISQAFNRDSHDSGTVNINGSNNSVNYNNGSGNSIGGPVVTSDHNNVPGEDYDESQETNYAGN